MVAAYGAERLMWGSDSPYQIVEPNTYADSLQLLTTFARRLTPEERQLMLSGTAEKVFFG